MEKHVQQFVLIVGSFFCQFVDMKVVGSMPWNSLLTRDTNQAYIFSWHKIKMSKQYIFIISLTHECNVDH